MASIRSSFPGARAALAVALLLAAPACRKDMPLDPETAPRAEVDRFSASAGTIMVRDGTNGLPEAGAPIDFDQGPFITTGLGPAGEVVQYYNFDARPEAPADIFVLVREGETDPVEGQLNVVDVIPGSAGYNDFWRVSTVAVPADYVANTITSADAITEAGFAVTPTDTIVNCPIVPEGSTAALRLDGGDASLHRGWFRDTVVFYFVFEEAALAAGASGSVPYSSVYVSFNVNPDQPGGGPPSGFMTEAGGTQTHNVVAPLPGDADYSPYWFVTVYDNADFASVVDLPSATAANVLAPLAAMVNCPVVSVN